jgi:hypothetical protein
MDGVEVPALGGARVENIVGCCLPSPVEIEDRVSTGECGVPVGQYPVFPEKGPPTRVTPECLQPEPNRPA